MISRSKICRDAVDPQQPTAGYAAQLQDTERKCNASTGVFPV